MEKEEFNLLNKDSFKVPDGYFDSVGNEVMKRIKQTDDSLPHSVNLKVKTGSGNGMIRKLVAAVSTAAAIFIIIFFFPNKSDSTYNLTELNDADIIEYLSLNADELEMEYLMSQAGKIQAPQESVIGNDEQYIEYLLDDIEESELLE